MADQAVYQVAAVLEQTGVPYMLVGSNSSGYYGTPRSTKDADFVVELGDISIRSLVEKLGDAFTFDPQMSFERVTGTQRYILQVKDTAFKIELFMLSEDAHDRQRFARRQPCPMEDRTIMLPTVEDVIITKVRWAKGSKRSKDADDVIDVLDAQWENIDWNYVHRWCDEHDTRRVLEQLKREARPEAFDQESKDNKP